ncbi:MAG: hypothetical protein H8E57_00350 [Candidatus Cloacimonetes bacterium]|nr:hypothetical protein [Candidatus Cloacimonadota bacterium]
MKKQISFSTLGNTYIHEMRDKINNSENKIDLDHFFSQTVTNFLNKVFHDQDFVIDNGDIIFNPDSENYFSVSDDLWKLEYFKEIWNSSDLPNVIKKFADSTYHRYLHLNKHPEKTQKKIRKHA